jgi:uncharacterized protein YkwD
LPANGPEGRPRPPAAGVAERLHRLGIVFVVGGLLTLLGGFLLAPASLGSEVGSRARGAAGGAATRASAALPPQAPIEGSIVPSDVSGPEAPAAPAEEARRASVTPDPPLNSTPAAGNPSAVPSAPTSTPSPRPATATPMPTATRPPPTATPVLAAASTPPPAAALPPPSLALTSLEQALSSAHNAERSKAAVAPLQLDPVLVAVARERAREMAANTYLSHTARDGSTAFTMLRDRGYDYLIAGENIARNNYPESQSVQVAMEGFMQSAGHRANILDKRFSKFGVGAALGADGMRYYVIIFAGN